MKQSPYPSPDNLRVFVALLLSFAILITPIAAVATPSIARASTIKSSDEKRDKAKSGNEELFVNPPSTGPALPAAQPEPAPQPLAPLVGSVTATLSGLLVSTANNNSGPDAGKADPGDTINYTAQLGNTTGSPANNLNFSVALDSHTTFVPGSLNSTPVAFDQSVNTNEDTPVSITISGQDPDGSTLTFRNAATNAPFGASTPLTNGTLGAFSAPDCTTTPGICTSTATYTPNANYNGSDSFAFRVNDSTANSNETGAVSITVIAVNDAPTFTVPGNPAATNEDAGAITVPNFITNVRPAQPGDTTEDSQTVSFVITNNTNSGLFSSGPTLNVVGASYPKTANLTYTSLANQSGTATITYHAHDTGGTTPGVDNSADQTFTITVNPVNDKPVVVAPAAFSVSANMKRTGLTGLLGNVTDPNDTGFGSPPCVSTPYTVTAASISATSPAGGTVSNVNLSTGTFDFDPPAGFTGGNVTFTYTVSDNGCPGVAISDPVTVTVTVSNPVIWFVNLGAAVNGDGRLSSPFNSLASANTAMGINANQRIFVYSTTASLTAASGVGVTLTTGQWLIGQGATDSGGTTNFDTLMGFTPPANTIARPSVNGTRPTIQGRVQMNASNTRVQGLNIAPPANTQALTGTNGSAMTGMQVGISATQSDVTITTSGSNGANAMGVSLNNAGGVFSLISVNVNGGAKGISLTTTTGSFTVLGSGATAGSGGTIQNTTNNGVEFKTATNVTLKNMIITGNATSQTVTGPSSSCGGDLATGNNLSCVANVYLQSVTTAVLNNVSVLNSGQQGINGNAVNGLTITNSTITGNGNEGFEDGILLQNASGTIGITGSTVTDNRARQMHIGNLSGTMTLNANTSSFGRTGVGTGDTQQGIFLQLMGTSNSTINATTLTINNSFFNNGGNVYTNAFQINADNGSPTVNGSLTSSSLDRYAAGVLVNAGGTANVTFDVMNNATMLHSNLDAINYTILGGSAAITGKITGTISGNTINGCEPAGSNCHGIDLNTGTNQNGELHLKIDQNTISQTGGGITLLADGATAAGTDKVHLKITRNNISNPGFATGRAAIELQATLSSPAGANMSICTDVGGAGLQNVISGAWSTGSSQSGIFLRHRFSAPSSWVLPGYAGPANNSGGQVETYLNGRNTNTATPFQSTATTNNSGYANGGACTTPLLIAQGGVEALINSAPLPSSLARFSLYDFSFATNTRTFDDGDAAHIIIAPIGAATSSLDQQQLDSTVSAAIERWSDTGLTPAQISVLRGVKFDVADLSSAYLGEADGSHVLIDRNGGGKGWYIGSNPLDDSVFTRAVSSTRRYTDPISAPAGHVDLLTAIMHEMGHKLGLDDSYAEKDRNNLMYGHLTVGERRLPAQGQAKHAQPGELKGSHFLSLSRENRQEPVKLNLVRDLFTPRTSYAAIASMFMSPPPGTFPVNGVGSGFTLPSGKTVTITFSVTLNNPPNLSGVPPATPQVSAFGSLSGSNVSGFNTNTVTTLVDLFNSTTTVTSLPTSSNSGQSVTFTAAIGTTGSPSGSGTNRTGTVNFKDGGVTIPGCGAQTVSSNQATCTTSGLSTATHTITAEYSGDGNFDPSNGTLAGGQVVTQSGTTTTVTSSLNPSFVSQNVTFTATVASSTAFTGPPTGTVQFKDGVGNLGSAQTLNGSGVATFSISSLLAGNHPISAVYSGDANFTTSTGNLSAFNGQAGNPQVVNKSNTTTVVSDSPPNSSTPTQTVTYTATVTSQTSVTGPFTGSVAFKDGVTDITSSCEGGSQALTSGGVATCKITYPDTTGQPHLITAVYSGDGTFNTSTSAQISHAVTETATTTVLASSQNPAAPLVTVTFTATVSSGSGTPTGTVTFYDGSPNPLVCDNGSTSVQTLSSGVATCDTDDLTEGGSPHAISAVYNGGGAFSGSTSNTVNQIITSCTSSAVVTSAADDLSTGTLRSVIGTVCDGGTITFDPVVFAVPGPHTIELLDANGKLLVNKNLTITGPGASVLTVKRASAATTNFRVFKIQASKTVTISGMTITNGSVVGANGSDGGDSNGGDASGGAISNDGTLTLTNVIISNSHVTGGDGLNGGSPGWNGGDANGGGIFNTGTLTLTNTTVSGNTATGGKGGNSDATPGAGGTSRGGGVYNLGTLTLTNSTVASNTATGGAGGDKTGGGSGNPGGAAGGGVFSTGTLTLTINNSTFSDNHAVALFAEGGGIDSEGGTLTINNSTISGNTSDGTGGGLLNCGDSTAVLTGVTITNNRADADGNTIGDGGGISQVSSNSITLRNTIVAGNFILGPQVETATVVGTITSATNQVETATVTTVGNLPLTLGGNASITVTAAGMTGTPKNVLVAVASGDDAAAVATKIRTALAADANIGDVTTGFFTVSGSGADIVLTAKLAAANDTTMNVSIDSCTCTGLNSAPTSANTAAGATSGAGNATVTVTAAGMTGTPKTLDVAVVDGDSASAVAGKMRTALAGDPDVNAFFNVSGATDQIILTARTAAANDPTMNIATDNGTSSGLTPEPTSANTQAGGITIADDVNGDVDPSSSFNLIGVDTGMTGISNGGPLNNQVGTAGAPINPLLEVLFDNGGFTRTHALKNLSPALETGNSFGLTTDQRGFPRPVNSNATPPPSTGDDSDIGAYERQNAPATPSTPDLQPGSDSGTSNSDNITNATPRVFDIAGVTTGATVELMRDTNPGGGSEVVAGSAVASGSTVAVSDNTVLADGDYYYRARQTLGTDTSALSPLPGLKVTIDTTVGTPSTPDLEPGSDSGVNNDNITNITPRLFDIAGTESGALVELLRGGTPIASTTGGGTVTLSDPVVLSDGPYLYAARQTDIAGNVATSSALTVTIDTVSPPTPGTPDLEAGSDSGTSNTDNITNATPRLFDVSFAAEAGSTVQLLRNGSPVSGGSASGASSPVTLTDSDTLSDNTYLYSVRQTDGAGNFSTSSTLSVTIDTTNTPSAPDLQPGSDSGASNSDNITNAFLSRTFDIPNTENGALVELYRGVTFVTSTTGNGGTVTLTDGTSQADGPYNYTTKQTDIAGNVATSAILTVTIDTLAPAQPATPDLQAGSDTGPSSSDNITNHAAGGSRTFDLSFTAEADSTIELLRGGLPIASGPGTSSPISRSDPNALSDATYAYSTRHTDLAGNSSTSASPLNVTIDTAAPTVSMTSPTSDPTSTSPIPVTVTFNEAVFGFTSGDITASNGSVSNFLGADGSSSYTFDLTPSAQGAVSANIAAGVATDAAGNNNTAALQFTRTYDTSGPLVSITAVSPDPRNTSVSSIQIVFNKAVTGFDLPDLTLKLNGGANLLTGAQTLTSGDNITWTLGNLSGLTTAEGTYVLKLTSSGSNIKDSANNPLLSDATETWLMDTTAPTVTVTIPGTQANPVTGPSASTVINFTVTFSESVTGFTASDVQLSGTAGATVANVSGSGTTYNVDVEGMTSSGAVTITIPAAAATDAAGNGNTSVNPTNTATVNYFKNDFTAFEVNSTADTDNGSCDPVGTGNGCTLREAINAANADAGAETITFAPALTSGGPVTISLLSALPSLTDDVTIQGPGANLLTVERNSGAVTNFRIFTTANATIVILSGLTITKGVLPNSGQGGGIFNGGTLTLNNLTISGNQTGASGSGGGVYSGGTLTINNSTISGNQVGSTSSGGGVYNGGTLTINNSTISGNQTGATGLGGGVYTTTTLTVVASTITGNLTGAGSQGGGIYNTGTATLKNTIVGGGNTAATAPDISGTVQSEGFNLIQSTSGAAITETLNPGTNITGQDPLLFALADNGGPTKTHALQCTSPAIDKGKSFGLTTDQRGGVRPFDLADSVYPNAVGGDGSDIGAYETQTGGGCQPVAVPPNPQPSTNEDTTVGITLTGTYSQNTNLTFTVTQSPLRGSLGPISAPNCNFNLSMTCTATVTYTPSSNLNGPDSFKFKVSALTLDSDEADVNITVNPVNDAPSFLITGSNTVNEDAGPQTVSNFANTISPGPADESGQAVQFQVTGNTNPGLFSAAPAIDPTGTLTYTPAANAFGSATITVRLTDNGGTANGGQDTSAPQSFIITVSPVADTPSVTNATTNEDTQTTSGLVISRNPADGAEVTHFKITGITNGTLFQNDGTTQINNGDFITFAQGNAGLKFTPNANLFSPTTTFSFQIQSSLNNTDAGLGGGLATATITVNAVADTPSVTNAATNEDTQTTSGLVISRNPADGAEVTHFQITGITNGILFKNNGTTPINNGDFITFAEGNAGLKFTPNANLFSPGTTFSFDVRASLNNTNAGLGGSMVTATITVNPVADTPSVTNATTNEDTQTTSGLVISRNAADGPEVTHFQITGITNGTLFQNNGTTQINNGDFITVAQGNAGLKFTPAANLFSPTTTFSFQVQASVNNTNAGLGGSMVTATITVNPVADTPSVTNATTNEDTQTTSGLVISRNAADGAEVTHFQITGITNGTLFQNNGTTQINNGDFITFAQGNAGLKFTPAANLFSPSTTFSFQVQASLSNTNAGLGGSLVTATITVNPVADTPSVTNATTNEDTQTTSGLVISRNAADGAEVTHFKITGITGGTLFQNNGTTPINNGDFITFAQGNAGLKFTPGTHLFSPGTTFSFQVQASLNNTNAGLGGGLVTATITVNVVAHTPSVTNATTTVNTQTTSGLVISRNALDGPEITHFKITNIQNGTLFQNNGTTEIHNNDFITFAQGNAGLKFTPGDNLANPATTFSFQVQASVGNSDAGLGGGIVTATITVIDNLEPILLTIEGSDRAVALDSVTLLRDPFSLLGEHNFSADHRTRIMLFALHAQLRTGETASAVTAEADDAGTITPLTVEAVRTVPNFEWLTEVVVKFPDNFSTGGAGPQDVKVRIRLRGANSNQAVITIVPVPAGP